MIIGEVGWGGFAVFFLRLYSIAFLISQASEMTMGMVGSMAETAEMHSSYPKLEHMSQ